MAEVSRWEQVSPEEAERHPECGIGGFLIFVALGLGVAALRIAYTTIRDFLEVTIVAKPLTYAIYLGAISVVELVFAGWALWTLLLLVRRSPAFPKSLAMLAAGGFVVSFIEAFSLYYVVKWHGYEMSWLQVFDFQTVVWLARAATVAAIAVPYAIFSRRVNVTFLHRVKSEDLTFLTPFPQPVMQMARAAETVPRPG